MLLQISRAAVEQYTGEGEPPVIEMTIKAANEMTTPPDLAVTAKITPTLSVERVKQLNIIKFEKEAQNVVKCVCQVFYHKEALNHWKARVAFFPKNHKKVTVLCLLFGNNYLYIIILCKLINR